PGPVDVIVWRKEHTVFHVVLAADEARALEHAAAGEPLAVICAAFEGNANAIERAARTIGSWFAEGWICDPMTLNPRKAT
ncbi:MAG TPA: hypothetical protein VMF89_35775, partial [Polyangiales bacterium]|nr:hypothetical protein [Polyangiales bacterium]